ncbi:3-oxoadipate enol-lactonase [Pseudoduganella namucuonensis]|uniref:3-oxoadipate enol-lactonase/3-oxoadipate enol-lactonase / 4-carboxymuconolactone decarboxylase n=1 Tax=Pseudoduganella namucuonensis TaxID=1035707 RepID=A0A1I7LZH2_9BURK|nr:3-oxoadipate enol-lactonase [Pseudoduganella namucuonensis]SFV15078.1 3-oxoadipate enol-lactonase/3-oxoadipate enol-lactonase / 4-carboxymuconolactone decarboxylase [Pseudoduganella namucuonensis]
MPILDPGPRQIAYQLEGPAGAPVLMFSNSLGTTMSMWRPQAEALRHKFRVLRYDTRGHGASGPGAPGCTLAGLGRDALRLLDALEIERASFCGISMGGLTGLWLGVHAGHRLQGLVVANSAARIGTAQGWRQRAKQVRAGGMDGVADGAAGRWFTRGYAARAPEQVAVLIAGLRACPAEGYAECCLALAEADLRDEIGAIDAPTLLIAGLQDPVTTVDDAEDMRGRIRHAACARLDASHLSNIEAAAGFTRALEDFLA